MELNLDAPVEELRTRVSEVLAASYPDRPIDETRRGELGQVVLAEVRRHRPGFGAGDLGGPGLDVLDAAILVECAASVDDQLAVGIGTSAVRGAHLLRQVGAPDQQLIARQAERGACALAIEDFDADVAHGQTFSAEQISDGWILSGIRRCPGASAAALVIISARVVDDAADDRSAFFLLATDAPGVSCRHADGGTWPGSPIDVVELVSARVGPDALLGPLGAARSLAGADRLLRLVLTASIQIGSAHALITAVVGNLRARRSLERAAVDNAQAAVADMHVAVDLARLLTRRAAWLMTVDGPAVASSAVAMAASWARRAHGEVLAQALQLLGPQALAPAIRDRLGTAPALFTDDVAAQAVDQSLIWKELAQWS